MIYLEFWLLFSYLFRKKAKPFSRKMDKPFSFYTSALLFLFEDPSRVIDFPAGSSVSVWAGSCLLRLVSQ